MPIELVVNFFLLRKLFNFLLYFIDYSITVVPIFPPLLPSTQHPPLPQTVPTPLFKGVSSLATPFPILYFISPWLYCNYQFVLLTPLTSSPIPPHPPRIWQPLKLSLYPWFLVCFLDSIVDSIYLLPFYCSYFWSLLKSLTFHIIMVRWWWTPLVSSCLESFFCPLILNDSFAG